jgi:hypothetical protein
MGLRPRDDCDALWEGLGDGRLSTLATDEYTTSYAVKMAGTDIETTPGGHVGIETRGLIGYSEGVVQRGFSRRRFVEVFSTNPARVTGLYPRKGLIAPGSDADLAIWDPDVERTITIDQLHHAGDYSPWEGWRVQGWPQTTILRGRLVVDRGELLAQPGDGIFIPRKLETNVLARRSPTRETTTRLEALDPSTSFDVSTSRGRCGVSGDFGSREPCKTGYPRRGIGMDRRSHGRRARKTCQPSALPSTRHGKPSSLVQRMQTLFLGSRSLSFTPTRRWNGGSLRRIARAIIVTSAWRARSRRVSPSRLCSSRGVVDAHVALRDRRPAPSGDGEKAERDRDERNRTPPLFPEGAEAMCALAASPKQP